MQGGYAGQLAAPMAAGTAPQVRKWHGNEGHLS
jgi:hypothetical protein